MKTDNYMQKRYGEHYREMNIGSIILKDELIQEKRQNGFGHLLFHLPFIKKKCLKSVVS